MSAPQNPQAFPTGDPTHGGHEGMTLRDWFAGQALAGILASRGNVYSEQAVKLAEWSYLHADAMLAAREQRA